MTTSTKVLLLTIMLGLVTRFTGLNWDSGFHLHPDERFLTMVSGSVSLPENLIQVFSTSQSTLNPHNVGHPFFVYGTFPIFVVKGLATVFSLANYDGFTLVGRFTSGVLDFFVILLVYLISFKIFGSRIIAAYSAFFYSALALPIQLSHYYSVDTFLTFFITLSYLFLLRIIQNTHSRYPSSVLIGLSWGLALASKYSAILFLPVIILGFVISFVRQKHLIPFLVAVILFSITTFVSFRVAQPFFFSGLITPNQRVITNIRDLKSFENPNGWFPPSVQWIMAPKIIFPAINLFWWGIGPGFSFVFIYSVVVLIRRIRHFPELITIFSWITGLFIYVGISFSMTGRYLYPLLPLFSVIGGFGLNNIITRFGRWSIPVVIAAVVTSLSFMSIYFRPHTRVQASEWINRNVPVGATISCEEWDDCLPLYGGSNYQTVQLHMYYPDSQIKWIELNKQLSQVDFLILSSNRVFASITSAPHLYPTTSDFYRKLFSGQTSFKLEAVFNSRPTLPIPLLNVCVRPPSVEYGSVSSQLPCVTSGLTFVDDYAEEAYTVYDHPAVYIFKNLKAPSTSSLSH